MLCPHWARAGGGAVRLRLTGRGGAERFRGASVDSRAARSTVLLLVAAAALAAPWPADACGDKFVRVGRGARYQRGYVAMHPGSIVLYVGEGATATGSLKGMESTLKAAGHRVTTVAGEALAAALKDGKHDVVLADLKDAPKIAAQVKAAPNPPELVPVMKKPTPDAFAAAEKEWVCVVESPGDKTQVLASIDQVLEKRK